MAYVNLAKIMAKLYTRKNRNINLILTQEGCCPHAMLIAVWLTIFIQVAIPLAVTLTSLTASESENDVVDKWFGQLAARNSDGINTLNLGWDFRRKASGYPGGQCVASHLDPDVIGCARVSCGGIDRQTYLYDQWPYGRKGYACKRIIVPHRDAISLLIHSTYSI